MNKTTSTSHPTKLHQIMKARGLSTPELANLTMRHPSTIANIANGTRKGSPTVRNAIAQTLNLPVHEIFPDLAQPETPKQVEIDSLATHASTPEASLKLIASETDAEIKALRADICRVGDQIVEALGKLAQAWR